MISEEHKRVICESVLKHLQDQRVEIIIFGSRTTKKHDRSSDLDVAIKAEGEIPFFILSFIEEELEKSNLPFRVDLQDYWALPSEFRKNIERTGVIISLGS